MRKWILFVVGFSFIGEAAWSQQAAPPPPAAPDPQAITQTTPEFLAAADEVLRDMSKLLDLPIKEPLKKSLRSKQEIREYLVREEQEDKDAAKRYADAKSLEALGLVPKGFPLESFLLDVLTDQVAGLYDPKAKEFYIADWIPLDEQQAVMAHELTHALEDQSFQIDPWIKGARPNDDAELARDAVSEGSALAAMVDYTLRDQKLGVRDLPDVTMLLRAGALGEMDKDPHLKDAPPFIRDDLLFPYLAGTSFSQQFLKAHTGWGDLKLVFENPPLSTQQILHPDLYLSGVKPQHVSLPDWKGVVGPEWKLLDVNVLGEFGLQEVLKQFLGQEAASKISPSWAGDRYAIFENESSKRTLMVVRLRLDRPEDATRLFDQYSEALEMKYKDRTEITRAANFIQFRSADGGVFLRCVASDCLSVEGAGRDTFDRLNHAVGWPAAPAPVEPAPQKPPGVAAVARVIE